MWYMFDRCVNLEYINLENFIDEPTTDYRNMFDQVPENIVICINPTNNPTILSRLQRISKCYIIDCSDDWKSKQKKILSNNGISRIPIPVQTKYIEYKIHMGRI